MKKYSKKEAANLLNLSNAYFYTCNKVILRYCYLHGKGDLTKGHVHFENYKNNIRTKYEELYFSFKTSYQLAKIVSPIYGNIDSAIVALTGFVSRYDRGFTIAGMRSIKKIIKKVEKNAKQSKE